MYAWILHFLKCSVACNYVLIRKLKNPFLQNQKKEKKTGAWLLRRFVEILYVYGMDLLYSLPSRASLYISATYGFLAGVSAPNSTNLAYTLTTYARAPM